MLTANDARRRLLVILDRLNLPQENKGSLESLQREIDRQIGGKLLELESSDVSPEILRSILAGRREFINLSVTYNTDPEFYGPLFQEIAERYRSNGWNISVGFNQEIPEKHFGMYFSLAPVPD